MVHHSKRIVVVGAGGRLGAALTQALRLRHHEVFAFTRSHLDVTNGDEVRQVLTDVEPDAIINCSAYNAVDAAETDREKAFAVNAGGPAALAGVARRTGALLVHYGTDFVFDGTASEPYAEGAPTNPLSVYGASKLAGEHEVRRVPRHYILRVESLFGGTCLAGQKATIDYFADQLVLGNPIRAFADRTVSPSYVPDVVRATEALMERGARYGTYHCVTSGFTTWYELAQNVAIRLGATGRVVPVRSEDVTTAAARPRFCALSNHKLLATGVMLPTWRSALKRHLALRQLNSRSQPNLRAQIA